MKKQMLAVILLSGLVHSTYAISPNGCRKSYSTMTDDFIQFVRISLQKLKKTIYTATTRENDLSVQGGTVTVECPNTVIEISGNNNSGNAFVAAGCSTDFNSDAVKTIMNGETKEVIATGFNGPIFVQPDVSNEVASVVIEGPATTSCPVTSGDQAEFDIIPGKKPVLEKVKECFVGLGNSELVQNAKNAMFEKPYATGVGAVAGLATAYFGIGQWQPKGFVGKCTKRVSQLAVIAAGAVAANSYVSEKTVTAGLEQVVNGVCYCVSSVFNR